MNKARKRRAKDLLTLLQSAGDTLDDLLSEETESLENTPESLQGTDRYLESETAVELLEQAAEALGEACDNLDAL